MADLEFRTEPVVELLDFMGGDARVASAARVSTGRDRRSLAAQAADEAKDVRADAGLINRLLADRHGTPFEHSVFSLRIETSIMVARESHRHRMASISEASLRYMEGEPVVYVPGPERHLIQSPGTKQMDYVTESGTFTQRELVNFAYKSSCTRAWRDYQHMLAQGILREVARGVLPLCFGTKWELTLNARSLMNYLSLRTSRLDALKPSHPQYEIEQVAEKIEQIFWLKMPLTAAAFDKNGRLAP